MVPARRAEPAASPPSARAGARAFYAGCLRELAASGIPFLVGGSYALRAHTGLRRRAKDLDVVCKPADAGRVLARFEAAGRKVEVEDARWIAKVREGELSLDVMSASDDGARPVDDTWFEHALRGEAFGVPVPLVQPAELLWQKAYIQLRHHHDGPDVAHLVLRAHDRIDWRRLLARMGEDWELLLAQLVNFRWIYPGERDRVPRWLMDELAGRLHRQLGQAPPRTRLCRGPSLSCFDYRQDIDEWGYADGAACGAGTEEGAGG